MEIGARAIIQPTQLEDLIRALEADGYSVVAPTLRDDAIVYDVIHAAAELPRGWEDEQEPGLYRVRRRDDDALFAYTVGPHSWKRFLHPPDARLWGATRTEDGFAVEAEPREAPRYAFLGVRGCELKAIAVHDQVFLGGAHVDPIYQARRAPAFIIAVNCGRAGNTCFCVSMDTGPRVDGGFDLALTEILEGEHRLLVEVGSARGAQVLALLTTTAASATDVTAANTAVERAASQMGRALDTTDIKALLYESADHPRWTDIAERCLTCANCTMVCPTCFCTTVEDVTDLQGDHAERWRRWDSCFSMEFSYIHGGSVRQSTASRYRQWLTHKLGSWIDQFGTSGCVGCGRCITWCPVGIDITVEVQALRDGRERAKGTP